MQRTYAARLSRLSLVLATIVIPTVVAAHEGISVHSEVDHTEDAQLWERDEHPGVSEDLANAFPDIRSDPGPIQPPVFFCPPCRETCPRAIITPLHTTHTDWPCRDHWHMVYYVQNQRAWPDCKCFCNSRRTRICKTWL
jgi:hypothetical protein